MSVLANTSMIQHSAQYMPSVISLISYLCILIVGMSLYVLDILQDIAAVPTLHELTLVDVVRFITFAQMLRPMLEVSLEDIRIAPAMLSPAMCDILCDCLGESVQVVSACWTILRHAVWALPKSSPSVSDVHLFNEHALARNMGKPIIIYIYKCMILYSSQKHIVLCFPQHVFAFFQLVQTIEQPMIFKLLWNLLYIEQHFIHFVRESFLYIQHQCTVAVGVVVYFVECDINSMLECHTRYYHNYFVQKSANTRTYYGGVPQIVQVAQHFYIESSLLELFATNKVFAWWVLIIILYVQNDKISKKDVLNKLCSNLQSSHCKSISLHYKQQIGFYSRVYHASFQISTRLAF